MGLFDIFGKKDAAADITKGSPFLISTELVPYRLYSRRNSSATLIVKVRNVTKDILLTSVVAELPERLGFDEMVLSRQREVRVGEMQPNEQKEVKFNVYGGVGSDAGDYTLRLTTIAHYRDYSHVLNAVRKQIAISVV
ncbi:MAG: hypothetical protein KGH94_05490 [Candidatus Micrarchaeota archaeon]|nr:hypothetical protein [Candidatus Micrarchaeota archaeon]